VKIKIILLLTLISLQSTADRPALHGMLFFGSKTLYASHLPMFHAPHNYQLLLEIKTNEPSSLAMNAYRDWVQKGETLFTIAPEVMDLTELINGERVTFKATLFKGHFERGGTPLGKIQIDVRKIVYSSKLNDSEQMPIREPYIIFGQKGEYFAAHLIQAKPSFDAIVIVKTPYQMVHHQRCMPLECVKPWPIADRKLPIFLKETFPNKNEKLGTPELGMSLGDLKGIRTEIENIVYLEIDELSQ
jgi:hypothetical protein